MNSWTILLLLVFCSPCGFGQPANKQQLPLQDLTAFRPQAGNWQLAGDVAMDPTIDIHLASKPVLETDKSRKKRRSGTSTIEQVKPVTFTTGSGILLNMNDDTRKDNLVTVMEHGDILLELEVMMPRGSNSGIYLQGRYEIQLLDSWGVRNPSFGDIGGIYRNWETVPGKIYMGKAPLVNAAKAPGLWQKMKISFRAPKFDGAGNKIANARFDYVELNGVKIHDNVEVPLPTGGPLENNEKPLGPLMIQGDHGPVAFRNIAFTLMKENNVSISDVAYKTWDGNFKVISDFATLPAVSGKSPELTCEVLETEDAYGALYTGNVNVPEDGDYQFMLLMTGGGKFSIGSEVLVDHQRPDAWIWEQKSMFLKAGSHPFEIYNFKDASWMPPRLGLSVEKADMHRKALHAFNSFPPEDNPRGAILVHAGSSPRMLRAFLDYKGDRSKRLTHSIAVGFPQGINYAYDLRSGNLVCVWRGDFADATPMWEDRGDGSFRPHGSPQYLFLGQPLAFLATADTPFPQAPDEEEFRAKGYVINDSTQSPQFRYLYRGMEVQESIVPENSHRSIRHDVYIKNRGESQNLYYKIAEGNSILPVSGGTFETRYVINDKEYYIAVNAYLRPYIRESNGKKELVILLKGNSLHYSIIW